MGFFEDELRKIVEPGYPGSTYVGRACYVRLDRQNRAKLEFVTSGFADQYDALRISILNKQEGTIDAVALRFSELLGTRRVAGRPKVSPHVWTNDGELEWYGFQPSERAYKHIAATVSAYLEVFQDQEQTQQWQQTL